MTKLGRFLQTDPIGTADGSNLYAYVGNDPSNRTDPTGLAAEAVGKVWNAPAPGFYEQTSPYFDPNYTVRQQTVGEVAMNMLGAVGAIKPVSVLTPYGPAIQSMTKSALAGLESVSAVARRHDIVPSQLFTWRRELREQLQGVTAGPIATSSEPACFVPAIVEPAPASASMSAPKRRRRQRRPRASVVELEMDGIAVKIAPSADKRLIAAVIEALKATR